MPIASCHLDRNPRRRHGPLFVNHPGHPAFDLGGGAAGCRRRSKFALGFVRVELSLPAGAHRLMRNAQRRHQRNATADELRNAAQPELAGGDQHIRKSHASAERRTPLRGSRERLGHASEVEGCPLRRSGCQPSTPMVAVAARQSPPSPVHSVDNRAVRPGRTCPARFGKGAESSNRNFVESLQSH
jgi:hypothetical protein